ncbi:MAG: hypothetical protein AB7T37_12935 [Dehalococcoidia bacterium]
MSQNLQVTFTWLRAGTWECRPPLLAEPASRPTRGSHTLVRVSDGTADVPYDLGDETAVQLLFRYREVNVRSSSIAAALDARQGKPPYDTGAALASLLHDFGPLRSNPDEQEPSVERPGELVAVDAAEFLEDIRQLAEIYVGIASNMWGDERAILAGRLIDYSEAAFREVWVLPRFRNDSFSYDVLPRTLRARVWEFLFREFDTSPYFLCKICAAPFWAGVSRGRKPLYCPEHRGGRYRQQAARRASLAQRNPQRFNIEPED